MNRITRRDAAQLLLAPLAAGTTNLAATESALKVLIVVAHPDDEYYFAATVYRIAQELGGIVDQVIITNGEAGYKYSTLAEKIYGLKLTSEGTGRSSLPEIRKREATAAGKILGIRHHYFLGEKDARFTLEVGEALTGIWNCAEIKQKLRDLLKRESYDFIFAVLPRETTHGHHQAATLLAIETTAELDVGQNPVVLLAEPGNHVQQAPPFSGLEGFPLSRAAGLEPQFTFNRRQSFGYQKALDYSIVVQWVIAEHKSQGLFQTDTGKHDVEHFWRLAAGPKDAAQRTEELARRLAKSEEENWELAYQ